MEEAKKERMTVKELYDYITKYMTPEEALMKLLGGQIGVYEKLKENKPLEDGISVNPIFIIAAAALDLGWSLAIEGREKNETVRGLVVGTEEYMETIFKDTKEENE